MWFEEMRIYLIWIRCYIQFIVICENIFEGASDEALVLGTSMSFSERLLANIDLPPPPPYSEHDSTGVTSQK